MFVYVVWVGEEGMEIKRQITGMMRLLSDKSGRVYQRVTTEQDSTTKEPQGRQLSWPQEPAPLPGDHQGNSWNSAGDPEPSPSSVTINPPNGPGCGHQGTGSKETKEPNKVHESHGRTELRKRNLISWWFCNRDKCVVEIVVQCLSVYDNKPVSVSWKEIKVWKYAVPGLATGWRVTSVQFFYSLPVQQWKIIFSEIETLKRKKNQKIKQLLLHEGSKI